jgi:Rrf2 family protein
VIALAEAGSARTSAELAVATKVPADYAVKILQLLARAGLVEARRGRGGGYTLRSDPKRTTLLDVVNVIDPLERITACPLGREEHRHRLCPLHSRLDEVIGLLRESLRKMTIRSVTDGRRGPALCPPPRVNLRVSAPPKTRRTRRGSRGAP